MYLPSRKGESGGEETERKNREKRGEMSSLRHSRVVSDSESTSSHIPDLSLCTVSWMQPRRFQNRERFHYLQCTLGWISTGPHLRELPNSSSFLRVKITSRILPIKVLKVHQGSGEMMHKLQFRTYLPHSPGIRMT